MCGVRAGWDFEGDLRSRADVRIDRKFPAEPLGAFSHIQKPIAAVAVELAGECLANIESAAIINDRHHQKLSRDTDRYLNTFGSRMFRRIVDALFKDQINF